MKAQTVKDLIDISSALYEPKYRQKADKLIGEFPAADKISIWRDVLPTDDAEVNAFGRELLIAHIAAREDRRTTRKGMPESLELFTAEFAAHAELALLGVDGEPMRVPYADCTGQHWDQHEAQCQSHIDAAAARLARERAVRAPIRPILDADVKATTRYAMEQLGLWTPISKPDDKTI